MDEPHNTKWTLLLGADELPDDLGELLRSLGLGPDFFKFSIWYATIDTLDTPQREQLGRFLMHPLSYLHPEDAADDGELVLPPLGKAKKDLWKVVTKINNHHVGLNPRIVFLLGFVDPESPTVHLTIHKQNP